MNMNLNWLLTFSTIQVLNMPTISFMYNVHYIQLQLTSLNLPCLKSIDHALSDRSFGLWLSGKSLMIEGGSIINCAVFHDKI